MDTPGPDPEIDLNPTERRLAKLRPSAVALNRDALMFEAGRASAFAERRGHYAPAMAAVLAMVAVGLGGLLARERRERQDLQQSLVIRVKEVTPPSPPSPQLDRPLEPDSYLALTRQLLAEGPAPSSPASRRSSNESSLEVTPSPASLRVRGSNGLVDL